MSLRDNCVVHCSDSVDFRFHRMDFYLTRGIKGLSAAKYVWIAFVTQLLATGSISTDNH